MRVMAAKVKKEVWCCLGCGRDTTARDGYCAYCKGGTRKKYFRQGPVGDVLPPVDDPMENEDRYDEESWPDWDDNYAPDEKFDIANRELHDRCATADYKRIEEAKAHMVTARREVAMLPDSIYG